MHRFCVAVLLGLSILAGIAAISSAQNAAAQATIRDGDRRDRDAERRRYQPKRDTLRKKQSHKRGERGTVHNPSRQREVREERREQAEPPRQHVEELRRNLERLQNELAAHRNRNDAHERRAELQREIERLEDRLQIAMRGREQHTGPRPHRDHEADRNRELPELEEMERRIGHIHAAAENMEQAGQTDWAHELHEKAEQMQRVFDHELEEREQDTRHNPESPALGEVFAAIKKINSEMQRLKEEVNELRTLLQDRTE